MFKAINKLSVRTVFNSGFGNAEFFSEVLLLAVFVLALPKIFAKTCSHVLPHNGLKFGTSQDAKL